VPSNNGWSFASDGRLITTTTGGTIASTYLRGWAMRNTDGAARLFDIGAAAVLTNNPAAVALNGLWFLQGFGVLYGTTEAVAASDVYIRGLRLRKDGALRIVVASPSAGDPSIGAFTFKQSTGQLYVQEIA
jgi:hypothetical protein